MKKYKKFLEAISGTIDTMSFGPGMPRQKLGVSLVSQDTEAIYDDHTGKIYTTNDYNDLYQDYLKRNPSKPLQGGFNKKNIGIILTT